jgi:uncharacterized membrane protein
MGLLPSLIRLPFMPVQGVIKLGEVLREEADRQLRDPARIRRELEQAQRRYEAGEISEEELTHIQDELTSSLVTEVAPPSVPGAGNDRS